MEWALAILLGAAIVLLILSFLKDKHDQQVEKQENDLFSISIMEEINQLHEKVRTIELDSEIAAHEAGISPATSNQRILLREVLDLYKRGYSFEGIAVEKEMQEEEIKQLLAPFMSK